MAKPTPFRRPSIDLDRTKRVWRTVRADQLEVGDTVAGRGKLLLRSQEEPGHLWLVFPFKAVWQVPVDEPVYAFQKELLSD